MRNSQYIFGFFAISLAFVFAAIFNSTPTYAADARQFNAGKIIDDAIFTNSNSMTVQEIQNFFNSKVTCDTWGAKTSELGEGTRRQWMANRGIYPPFRCVTDYYENPATGENNFGKTTTPAGAISAAQIVYNYSKQYNINPQSIIATLQKENGMITDQWPTPKQFTEAMGFGCPDNVAPGAPACDPAYKSFATQVYQGTRHFRGYMDNQYCNQTWCTTKRVGQTTLQWNPDIACGTSSVYIENKATSALYTYTPYRPNQSALNAQYGLGDGCGAYGNRNFYLYFTDWFGSTSSVVSITSPLRITGGVSGNYFTKTPTTVSFDITNIANYAMGIGSMAVTVRDSQGRNFDYALKPILVPANSTVRYESSQTLPAEGTYTFGIVNYKDSAWNDTYPSSSNAGNDRTLSVPVVAMPTLTSNLSTVEDLRVGKASPVTFTVRNNSAQELNIGKVAASIRGPLKENLDLAPEAITLASGQSYVYTKTFTPSAEGVYALSIASTRTNGAVWETNYPLPENNIVNNFVRTVKPAHTITSGVNSSTANLHTRQSTQVSFTLKNHSDSAIDLGKIGLMGRDPQGRNVDPGVVPVVLAAGEEKVVSFNFTPTVVGGYKFGIIQTKNSGATWTDGPSVESGSVLKTLALSVADSLTVTQGPLSSVSSLHVGQGGVLSIKLKNHGSDAIDLGKIGLMGRDPQGRNVDPGVVPVVLAAGEEKVVSFNFTPTVVGGYKFGIIQTKNSGATWTDGPSVESGNISKDYSINAKPSITITEGILISNESVSVGQTRTLSYKVKNFSNSAIDLGKIGLMGRDPQGRNVDPGVVPVVLAAGEEKVVSFNFTPTVVGGYLFATLGTADGNKSWNDGPVSESLSQSNAIRITVN